MLRVYVAGQKAFGVAVAAMVAEHYELVGVCAPTEDRLHAYAAHHGTRWTETPDVPEGTDVIVAAHSHAFIGRKTRARAPFAIGYHPSLLPLHRGRDSIRWALHMGERVLGGTVYHLTDHVDAGPIAAQEHVIVGTGATPADVWRHQLAPLGLELLDRVLDDIAAGHVTYVAQDETLATWEPSWERPPMHRPELLELPASFTYIGDPEALHR